MLSQFLRNFRCNNCGQKMVKARVAVLAKSHRRVLAHVSCPHCGAEHLLTAAAEEQTAKNFKTDLTPNETERFLNTSPLSSNDLIDLHQSLKSFNGDFAKLLAAVKPSAPPKAKSRARTHQLFR